MRLVLLLLIAFGVASSLPAATLFLDDFESGVDSNWSAGASVLAPNGSTRFLGLFARNQETRLTLTGLPTSGRILLNFDLYINRSWDGNHSTNFGPDIFTAEVVGGPILLHTTFSNTELPGFEQSYPSPWNSGNPAGYTARTGAFAINTLGFTNGGDTTYRFTFPILLSSPDLTIRFAGLNLQDATDENWGLDNVSVTTTPEPSSGIFLLLGIGAIALHRARGGRGVPPRSPDRSKA